MKVITLWQPWASLIALGQKKIETRSWPNKYRGPMLIHSSKNFPSDCRTLAELDQLFNHSLSGKEEWVPEISKTLPLGCIIAIANLVDCAKIQITNIKAEKTINPYNLSDKERSFGDYTYGRFAWILDNVHQIKEPIPTKGMQGLWKWNEIPHLVAIDPHKIGSAKIWTPQGVRTGKKITVPNDDMVMGLEVV